MDTQTEYTLLTELAPLSSNTLIASTYDTLLTPLLTLFMDTLSSLTSLIKRSLHKYTFHALSAFSALTMSQGRWESVLAKRGREGSELRDGLNATRGVCLRSFLEFLADLKLAAACKGGDLSVGLADITISTAQYLNCIPDVQDAVGSVLSALGDGNWKMGDGKQALRVVQKFRRLRNG